MCTLGLGSEGDPQQRRERRSAKDLIGQGTDSEVACDNRRQHHLQSADQEKPAKNVALRYPVGNEYGTEVARQIGR